MAGSRTGDDADRPDERQPLNTLSGSVGGSVVQAGAVHGDVHFHDHAPGPRRPPRQLLAPPAHFTNRTSEIAELERALDQVGSPAPAVVLLKGHSGVGKTALALHWAYQIHDRFPGGALHAHLRHATGDPVAAEDILGDFLRALGVSVPDLPSRLTERAALFRSLTADVEIVVVLDDAVSAAQVRTLVPGLSASVVIVTSRHPLVGLVATGAVTVQVDPLDRAGAVELLGRHVGAGRVAAEQRPAEALAELCGGLPIALCVAAALTVSRPRRSLAWMVRELSDERDRLDVLSVEDDFSVRSTLDVSYRDLPEYAARGYRILGLYPGSVFCAEVVASAMTGSLDEARRTLDALVDASLADQLDDERFRLHDLVRVHAGNLAVEDENLDVATTVRRIAEWFLAVAGAAAAAVMPARRILPYAAPAPAILPADVGQYDSALAWLSDQRLELVAAVRAASEHGWLELSYHLADRMQPLFILHKHYCDAIEVCGFGLRAAMHLHDYDAEKNMRKHLARMYARRGKPELAEEFVTGMLSAARASDDRVGEASALKSMGMLRAESGQQSTAVTAFVAALTILRGLDRPRSEGLLLIELGSALAALDRHEDSISRLERARSVLSKLPEPDLFNATRALRALGSAHATAGNLTVARDLLDRAATSFGQLKAHHDQAATFGLLAEVSEHLGQRTQAQRYREAASAPPGTAGPVTEDD